MRGFAIALLAALAAGGAHAEERAPAAEHRGHGQMGAAPVAPACAEPAPRCAQTAEPAFAGDGRLWLAYAVGEKVFASVSEDKSAHFAPPVVVATESGGVIDANGEARPKIVPLANGALLVSYTARPANSYNGVIRIARSTDGGKSFSEPRPLVEGAGQRFDTYVVSPAGRIYAAWLDKRDAEEAKKSGQEFSGSGIAVGWSDDGGETFAGRKILLDHSCECCRVSAALDLDGAPVFAWRHVFGENLRDHYVAKLSQDGAALVGGRVSDDNWATTCPHHGPSLAIDAGGSWHVAWFTNGKTRKGLFYAKSRDGGKSFTAPAKFGDDAHAPSHAVLLAAKSGLYRAWKEFDGTKTAIVTQISQDGGDNWSAPLIAASTAEASDHPLLVEHDGVAYLSWLTREEGYRLLPLARAHAAAMGE